MAHDNTRARTFVERLTADVAYRKEMARFLNPRAASRLGSDTISIEQNERAGGGTPAPSQARFGLDAATTPRRNLSSTPNTAR